MSRKREPLNIGMLVREQRGRGRPRDTESGLRAHAKQLLIVGRVAELRLRGASRDAAIAKAAMEFKCSEHTVTELHKANLQWSLLEVASELDLIDRTKRYSARADRLLAKGTLRRKPR